MTLTQTDLDALLDLAIRLQGQGLLVIGRDQMTGEEIVRLANDLAARLTAAGAVRRDREPATLIPLGQLTSEANRAYLRALLEAREAALTADEQRWPGCGDDGLAVQEIDLIIGRVQREIDGGRGSGE